jgi:hypothetical protein
MKATFLFLLCSLLCYDLLAQVTLMGNIDPDSETAMLSITSDVRFSTSTGEEDKNNGGGTGSLGIKFSKGQFYGSTQFIVLASDNSITASDTSSVTEFGKNLLIPQNGGTGFSSFFAGLGYRRFDFLKDVTWERNEKVKRLPAFFSERLGGYAYFTTNKMTWKRDTVSMPVVLNAVGVLFTYELFNWELTADGEDGKAGDRVSLSFLGGYTGRRIGGDIGLKENAETLKRFIGTSERGFDGWELGGLLEVGNFYGRMSLTGFPEDGIAGFSSNQVLIMLGLNANLNIPAKKKTSPNRDGSTKQPTQ